MPTKPSTPSAAANNTAPAREDAPRKNKRGQIAYKPEYCDIAIETLSQGHSMAGLAGRLGVARATLFNWRAVYPDFDDACKEGMAGAVYWWEQRAHELAKGGKGNPAMIIFGLKNRAADDWRDRVEHTGAGGGAIETVTRIEYAVVRPKAS